MTTITIARDHINHPATLLRRARCPGSGKMERGYGVYPTGLDEHWALVKAIHTGLDFRAFSAMGWVKSCQTMLRQRESAAGYQTTHHQLLLHLTPHKDYLPPGYEPMTSGVVDCVMVYESRVVVIMWDFTTDDVQPRDREMEAYCAMAMQKFDRPIADAVIHQPRTSHTNIYTRHTSFRAVYATVEDIVRETRGPEMTLKATAEGCEGCTAWQDCPAFELERRRKAGE